jgi:hypothetical protein
MTRTTARPLLWTLTLLPFVALPAAASSITTYGTIVITSFGTNGLVIQLPDQQPSDPAVGQTAGPGSPTFAGGSDSVAVSATPTGLSVQPTAASAGGSPVAPAATPKGAAGNTSAGGVSQGTGTVTDRPNPVGSDVPPSPPIDIATGSIPVAAPPSLSNSSPTPAPSGPPIVTPIDVVSNAPPVAEHTPEPASLTLLTLAGLGGLRYFRRHRTEV